MKGEQKVKMTTEQLLEFDEKSYVCIDCRRKPCYAREHGNYGRCGALTKKYEHLSKNGTHTMTTTHYESGECPFYKPR